MSGKDRMPYQLIKLPTGKYRVINTETKKVHSDSTTKEKAQSQLRLLNAIEYGGFKPTGKQ